MIWWHKLARVNGTYRNVSQTRESKNVENNNWPFINNNQCRSTIVRNVCVGYRVCIIPAYYFKLLCYAIPYTAVNNIISGRCIIHTAVRNYTVCYDRGWGLGGENATSHGELIKTREFYRQNVTNWVRVHRHRAIDGVRMTYEWWRWCVNNDIIMLKFVFPNNAENVSQRRALEKKKKFKPLPKTKKRGLFARSVMTNSITLVLSKTYFNFLFLIISTLQRQNYNTFW